jgi:type I restriction enzyme S subunit
LGKVALADRVVTTNQQINALVPDLTKVSAEYATYLFASERFRAAMIEASTTTTVTLLNKSKLSEIRVPLPSLEEQRRIVAKLDEISALARSLARNAASRLKEARELRVQQLVAAFSGYELRTCLADVATITKGVSYTSSQLRETGRVMVNLKNVAKGGGFRPEGNKFFDGEAQDERVLQGGELLIAYTDLTKEREILGCPVIVPRTSEYVGAVFSMDLGRISPDPAHLSTEFLAYWLQSPPARAYMKSNASGATVMHLRTASVPAMQIPLPPLEEQKKIVTRLDEVMALVHRLESTHESLLSEIEHLRRAAVAELLAGKA